MRILVTGGTTFVSKFVAEYFVKRGDEVFVINRNTRAQVSGVHLIECDRADLGDRLKKIKFDAVLDVCTYNEEQLNQLLNALGEFKEYVFISSSAVYPQTNEQPFKENQPCGKNCVWGDYGTNKLNAEKLLQNHVNNAYILRPPYLYGVYENLYREAFVFDCAENNRPFYIPSDGKMKLQFFNVSDLCRFIEILLLQQPKEKYIMSATKSRCQLESGCRFVTEQ